MVMVSPGRPELCRNCEDAATSCHAAASAERERPQKAGVSQRNPGAPAMKLFSCQACGQLLYFENIRCENCGRALGYLTDLNEISAVEEKENGSWLVLANQ